MKPIGQEPAKFTHDVDRGYTRVFELIIAESSHPDRSQNASDMTEVSKGLFIAPARTQLSAIRDSRTHQ
jgi:hypothetical protein